MFWKKKEPCFHDWKTSDYFLDCNFMGDADDTYEITCTKCKKKRLVGELEHSRLETKGFITK